jgi:hypothetical protein
MRSNSDGRDFLHQTLFPVCTREAQFVFTCRVIDSGKVSKFADHTDAKKKQGALRTSLREKKLKFLTEKVNFLKPAQSQSIASCPHSKFRRADFWPRTTQAVDGF